MQEHLFTKVIWRGTDREQLMSTDRKLRLLLEFPLLTQHLFTYTALHENRARCLHLRFQPFQFPMYPVTQVISMLAADEADKVLEKPNTSLSLEVRSVTKVSLQVYLHLSGAPYQ